MSKKSKFLDIVEDEPKNDFYFSQPENSNQQKKLEEDEEFWEKLEKNIDTKSNAKKIKSQAYYNGMLVPGPPFGIEPSSKSLIDKASSFFDFSQAKLLCSIGTEEELKDTQSSEIAFAGRSNVGKSSLINSIVNGPLSVTSSTPGRTRRIFIYNISNVLNLVDLPGYGYAEGNEEQIREWNKLIEIYIKNRRNLRKLYHLIDSRYDLFQNDKVFLQNLSDFGIPTQIVLTKCDQVKHEDLCKRIEKLYEHIEKFSNVFPQIIPTSASNNSGIDELQAQIIRVSGLIEIGYFLSKDEKAKFEREHKEHAKYAMEEQRKLEERAKTLQNRKKFKQSDKEKERMEKIENELKKKKQNTIIGLD